jgi:hypothetical protein
MAYFKKMTFDRSSAEVKIEKVTIENGLLVDDGVETISLVQSSGNTAQMFRISRERTTVGKLFKYTHTADVEIPAEGCQIQAPFGYIDTQTPTAESLAEIAFGEQLEQKTVTVDENVAPSSGTSNQSIPVGATGKFVCIAATIGEDDMEHSEVMPTVSVMENRKFYVTLIERDVNGTKTYYDVLMMNKSNS